MSTPPTTPDSGDLVDDTDASAIVASLSTPARFDVVFERHHGAVFRYVVARVGPGTAADDVVGDVFVDAFAARARFDPSICASALPWLLGFATRRIARHRRLERRWLDTARHPDSDTGHDPTNDEDHQVQRADASKLAHELTRALAALRPADRDPLLLYVLAELSYEEISAALDIPIGTVRSRIARARTRLAGLLDGVPR